jgi:hypothetical protein
MDNTIAGRARPAIVLSMPALYLYNSDQVQYQQYDQNDDQDASGGIRVVARSERPVKERDNKQYRQYDKQNDHVQNLLFDIRPLS